MGKFVVKQSDNGFSFQLKAANGETIAVSQVYKSERTCAKGILSVCTNAPKAPIEDSTEEGFAALKNPKFEVYKDNRGEIRFRLKASNGQVICASEGYTSRESCMNGIASVKKNVENAKTEKE
ncbi:MAG: YegP family protein [Eubacteriales bacterium]|nr:YegP family protein [Eubacteriales bacterium]MDD3883124.1 YegP family protein [Eubacteriales bacterium]MDD4512706.1 YegP family protein [Eubacteriales bacterium]